MKQLARFFAIVLVLAMTASLLEGCGGEKPEPVQWPSIASQDLQNGSLAGDWETESALLTFDGADKFWFTEHKGDSMEGRYLFDGLELWLKDRDGVIYRGCMDRSGNLTLDEYPGIFVCSEGSADPAATEETMNPAILGDWLYQNGDLILTFAEDGSFHWEGVGQSGDGAFTFDGMTLALFEGDQVPGETGYLDEDLCLHLDSLEGWFYQEGGISYKPIAEDLGRRIAPDYPTEKKRIPLQNGVVSFQPEKGVYAPFTAEWVVAQTDLTPEHEGNRAIAVVGSCFEPYKYIPNLTGTAMTQMEYALYDRYTGLIFPTVDAQLGDDGRYHYEFDSRDGRVELSIHKEDIFEGATGDCFGVLSVVMQIEMPQWYDGLAFAALPVPETYEELQERNSMPRIAYHAHMAQMDPQRIQNALKFNIG